MKPEYDNEKLLKEIRRRDMVYRILQVASIIVTGVAFLFLSVGQANANRQILQGVQQQNTQLQKAVEELKKDSNEKLDLQNRSLQCIAEFFATTDRTNRVIQDIDQCLILNKGQPTSVLPTPTAPQQGPSLSPNNVSSLILPTPSASPVPVSDTPQPAAPLPENVPPTTPEPASPLLCLLQICLTAPLLQL